MERVAGIEPAQSAWKAEILPLNYTRISTLLLYYSQGKKQCQDIFLKILLFLKECPQSAILHFLF